MLGITKNVCMLPKEVVSNLSREVFEKMLLDHLVKRCQGRCGGPENLQLEGLHICLGHTKQVSSGLGPNGKIPSGPRLGL